MPPTLFEDKSHPTKDTGFILVIASRATEKTVLQFWNISERMYSLEDPDSCRLLFFVGRSGSAGCSGVLSFSNGESETNDVLGPGATNGILEQVVPSPSTSSGMW